MHINEHIVYTECFVWFNMRMYLLSRIASSTCDDAVFVESATLCWLIADRKRRIIFVLSVLPAPLSPLTHKHTYRKCQRWKMIIRLKSCNELMWPAGGSYIMGLIQGVFQDSRSFTGSIKHIWLNLFFKEILLLKKIVLNWSKVTVKSFTLLQNILFQINAVLLNVLFIK